MTLYPEVVAEVEASESGEHIGAFFDFDGTIIHGFSAFVFIREQLRAGHINVEEFLQLGRLMMSFGFGSMDFSTMLSLSSQFLSDMSEETMETFSKKVYEKFIAKSIYPESRAIIEAHLKKGHTVAIISSATQYQVKYAADDLGVDNIFTSILEIEEGILTGRISSSCYGVGKVNAAKSLIEEKKLDTQKSYFYSDGDEDVPLLELVGNPRPLNPNRKLSDIAEDNNWPVRRFKSRGRPTLQGMTRSVAAYGALLTSFAAGAPILALTRSTKKARNFSISLFADSASALIGLDIKVKNEHRLWSHRPAVFIFNHQSKTDFLIATSLLRKDVVGIGKQELKKIPVIGQVLEQAGIVMIDRKNTSSSIEAMKPLVNAMNKDQQSVCVAPEGTRSVSKKLAPFKKGAFHIAMQAQVPIVPIVIHNALDSAPKGRFEFTPCTVEVEILEPVETDDWTVDNMEEKIAEIWHDYASTLGLEPSTAKTANKNARSTKTKTSTKRKSNQAKSPNKKSTKKKASPKRKTVSKTTEAPPENMSDKPAGSSSNNSATRKSIIPKSQIPNIDSLRIEE